MAKFMTKFKFNNFKKIGIISGAFVGVILIVLLITAFVVTRSSTTVAYVNVEKGLVEVNVGDGWIPAIDGMELDLNDEIKTGSDGEASLILYESAIVSLEPNTKLSITDLSDESVKIKQESGSTWNKFTGLSGLKGLEIETPNTVATVRGTEFGVKVDGVTVMEGEVKAKSKVTGKFFNVGAGRKAFMNGDNQFILEELSVEERKELTKKMQENLDRLRNMRNREIQKHPKLVKIAMNKMSTDEKGLRSKLQEMDEGKYNPDVIIDKSPIKSGTVKKFTLISKKIQVQHKALQQLNEQAQNDAGTLDGVPEDIPDEIIEGLHDGVPKDIPVDERGRPLHSSDDIMPSDSSAKQIRN